MDNNNNDKLNQNFRISLDPKSHKILRRDMELFKIPKISTFVNRIITNYYEFYQKSTFSFFKVKQLIMNKTGADDVVADKIVEDIYRELRPLQQSDEKSSVSISIRPNSESENTFSLIIQSLDQTLHSSTGLVVKNILLEYTKLSRLEREKIIFKGYLDLFRRATQENLKLIIETDNVTRIVYPGTIIEPLDDYGNYLLVYNEAFEKMSALLLRGVNKMYPNGEHFTHKRSVMTTITTYQNKDLSIFSKSEIETLQILLSKYNLDTFNKILKMIEDTGDFKFDRLSIETILVALPELKRQKISLTQDELDKLPNKI